jgi:hypothetical protein
LFSANLLLSILASENLDDNVWGYQADSYTTSKPTRRPLFAVSSDLRTSRPPELPELPDLPELPELGSWSEGNKNQNKATGKFK